jgi:hypothetical protein
MPILCSHPLTYASATLQQSVAGNLTFRGTAFCNLGTPKTVISNFVTTRLIETPYSSPCKYDHPKQCSRWTKKLGFKKSLAHSCINSFLAHKLSHVRWLWFFWKGALTGPYPTLRFDGACGLGVGVF